MALRHVILKGDPLLRKRSREITDITDRIKELADDMWETMYEANGIGLAAPQVGVLRRLIVIDVTEPIMEEDEDESATQGDVATQSDPVNDNNPVTQSEAKQSKEAEVPEELTAEPGHEAEPESETVKYVLINPVLIEVSEEKIRSKEGCLSVPGKVGMVERPARVKVRAMDLCGEYFEIEGEGMLAKALLHEIDHLDGVLYTDIAESLEEIGTFEQQEA